MAFEDWKVKVLGKKIGRQNAAQIGLWNSLSGYFFWPNLRVREKMDEGLNKLIEVDISHLWNT